MVQSLHQERVLFMSYITLWFEDQLQHKYVVLWVMLQKSKLSIMLCHSLVSAAIFAQVNVVFTTNLRILLSFVLYHI